MYTLVLTITIFVAGVHATLWERPDLSRGFCEQQVQFHEQRLNAQLQPQARVQGHCRPQLQTQKL